MKIYCYRQAHIKTKWLPMYLKHDTKLFTGDKQHSLTCHLKSETWKINHTEEEQGKISLVANTTKI